MTTAATPPPTPNPAVTQPAGRASAPGPRRTVGIADNFAAYNNAHLAAKLDDIKSLGATWVRYDIEWSNIQYEGPGKYNWTDYDRAVKAVSGRGLNSLLIIDYSPPWARQAGCKDTAMCAPADPQAYGAFAGEVAKRYSRYGIHHYEIWNEPNNANFFRPSANVAHYTAMLKAAHAAIKAADPKAVVITAGLSPAATWGDDISPPDFVRGMYANGAKGHFDALAHHPYTWPTWPGNSDPNNAWGQLAVIHTVMAVHGDGAKKIWLTEYGAPTGGGGHVSETVSAQMLSKAVATAGNIPWLGPLFWYTYQDPGVNQSNDEDWFGLIRANGTRKPAYDAFRSAAHGS
jgi:beta-xylosidase